MRVCDALLFRRGLPLYPVPPAGQAPQGWEQWIGVGFDALRRARADHGLYRPGRARRHRLGARSDARRAALGRLCETYPDAVFCALLGHRPSPKRTPWGAPAAHRGAAHEGRRGRRRRAVAPHARRARRLRRGLRRLRARHGPRAVGGRARGGRRSCCPCARCSTATTSSRRPLDAPARALDLQWRRGSHPRRPRRPLPHQLRPAARPRQAARRVRRRHAGGRPRRAQGAAAHGRRRGRRRADPAARQAAPEPLPRPGQGRRRSRRSRAPRTPTWSPATTS